MELNSGKRYYRPKRKRKSKTRTETIVKSIVEVTVSSMVLKEPPQGFQLVARTLEGKNRKKFK